MAKAKGQQRTEAHGVESTWETLSDTVVARLKAALEHSEESSVGDTLLNGLSPLQREQLTSLRQAYFAALWNRKDKETRSSLLYELERAARTRNLPWGSSASLVLDHISQAARAVRGSLRAKADSLVMWSAFEALSSVVRTDHASADARQRDTEFDDFALQTAENVQAISASLYGLAQATLPADAAEQVIAAVRNAFGWDYASYWTVTPAGNTLALELTSGDASELLRRAHDEAKPTKGDGLFGSAWKRGDVTDLVIARDAPLHETLYQAGARMLLSFPVMLGNDRVVGVMAFLVRREFEVSESRRDALRNIAILVSSSFERMAQVVEMRDLAASADAVSQVLRRINGATSGTDAARGALDAVREAFGWDYGSYWARTREGTELELVTESGNATEAFSRATRGSRYTQGQGVSGKAWQSRDLVFVRNLGAAEGEHRAQAARAAGIRSGVCFPLIARDQVVGVIEVWSTRDVQLSDGRIEALRSVGTAASSTLERLEERDRFAGSLRDFAGELIAVSSSLRATTAEQSASAQELASAIGQVTATLSELRETSSEALRNAESVIGKAEGAFQTSASGRSSVERAIESMRVIREQVGEIAERILQLNDQTSQIGSIIATVNEISAQSKLLALNAAIEAARAGEHGKGFGVVASEIRSLAEQSKEATGQVREILGEIQSSTNAAVVAAEEGTKKSESGMALADLSGEKIQELARSMEESSSSARLIANSARQQGAGIEQVAQALVSISNATNDTAAGLKQTEQATAQLVMLAERMATIVRAVVPAPAQKGAAAPDNQNAAE